MHLIKAVDVRMNPMLSHFCGTTIVVTDEKLQLQIVRELSDVRVICAPVPVLYLYDCIHSRPHVTPACLLPLRLNLRSWAPVLLRQSMDK